MQTKQTMRRIIPAILMILIVFAWTAEAARKAVGTRPTGGGDNAAATTGDKTPDGGTAPGAGGDMEARRLLERANELLAQGSDKERAVKMLETILEQYPSSPIVYPACLSLGRYYLSAHEQVKAVGYLNRIKALEPQGGVVPAGPDREVFLEGMYLIGTGYFQTRQFGMAFPPLRVITGKYPNTVWANQAYYYIGMCHFAQQNWNKAIEALSMVGTFVDPSSPTTQFVEAGRRFYVKVRDADFPVLMSLGRPIRVAVETQRGDKEDVECIPLSSDAEFFIGSISTEVGNPKPGDHVLQVIGGDTLVTRYSDESTQDGSANVARTGTVKVVSTAMLGFTMGDYEGKAATMFCGQPGFVLLQDADLDVSDNADTAEVTVISRYKVDASDEEETTEEAKSVDVLAAESRQEERKFRYVTRDQLTLRLTERSKGGLVHSGAFVAQFPVGEHTGNEAADTRDASLACVPNDEVVVTYVDQLHIGGDSPKTLEAVLPVMPKLNNNLGSVNNVVSDPVIRARKDLVEAMAFLELARIFKSMGLAKGAAEKAQEGLTRVDSIIRMGEGMPVALKQDAFKTKWELHIASDDFPSALATCGLFGKLFPDSPLVGEALMGIANIRLDNREYGAAIETYKQILALPNSEAKAEAQFRIAECIEITTAKEGPGRAVQEYKLCADRYPGSMFAGQALAKMIDYNVENQDFAQANALLEQTFQDYPDSKFLDALLLKWVLVSFRMGDYEKARQKCAQILFEYPETASAATARTILPKIEAQLKKKGGGGGEAGGESAKKTEEQS